MASHRTACGSRPRLLLTLPDHPWPLDSGKRMRCATALAALTDLASELDADLDVAVVMAGEATGDPPERVRARAYRTLDPPLRGRLAGGAAALLGRLPWQVAVVRWRDVRLGLPDPSGAAYDLVWFGALDHAVALSRHVDGKRVVVDLDDVETDKIRAFLALPGDTAETRGAVRVQRRLELPLWARLQRWAQGRADVVVVCSELDRSRMGAGERVHVVPNAYRVPAVRPVRRRRGPEDAPVLLLVGTFAYGPNLDAAEVAARQVLPAVRQRHPGARLRLVGRGSAPALTALGRLPGVELVGQAAHMAPELAAADVSLVPVRFGGGTRLKVLEAFAHGVPVVSTSLGCEGLGVVDGEHLLVADRADALAGAVCRLLEDDALRSALVERADQLVRERFTPEVAASAVREAARRALRPAQQ